MGFTDFSLLISLLVAVSRTNKPRVLADCLGNVDELAIDLSWMLHRSALSRHCAIAILLAFCEPTPANIATAISIALCSDTGQPFFSLFFGCLK